MLFSNKIKEDANESQFSTSKISDLVPNTITNQERTEEASSSMGKTVNQAQNTIESTMSNNNEITTETKKEPEVFMWCH